MTMSLEKWQEHLETHFEKLVRIRSSSGLPIFALEHGLSEEGIEELSILLLRSYLAANRSLQRHWLAWVVYAAEEGYTYTGEEYWHSFERSHAKLGSPASQSNERLVQEVSKKI